LVFWDSLPHALFAAVFLGQFRCWAQQLCLAPAWRLALTYLSFKRHLLATAIVGTALSVFPSFAFAQSSQVKTSHLQAELVVHAPDGLKPGKALWLGLLMCHVPHWHTYWENPGDSGLATTLLWKLPAGTSERS
jgi:DsbC/DsbD-like thiol-disulfide interchange protein